MMGSVTLDFECHGEFNAFTRFCNASLQWSVSSGHPGHVERIAPLRILMIRAPPDAIIQPFT